nr:LysR family transcriptional regulator substrate-binding protein [Lacrimispora amygdalina]
MIRQKLSSFAKAPFLLLRPETIAYERAVRLCAQNGFAPNIRLQLDPLATAYRSCGAGLGVTLLSDTVVRMSDHDEPVVFYKLDSDDVSRDIAVMWKKKRYVSKAMEKFTKLAAEMFSG